MKISVVICTWNGEKYIQEQLESIIGQSRKVDEIILRDDGSSDRTIEIAEQVLKNAGIPYSIIQNKVNLGVSANFEKGIREASGVLVLTSDQDDVWMNKKVEIIEARFAENPQCVLMFTDGYVTDGELNVIRNSIWDAALFTQEKKRKFLEKKYYDVLLSDNVVTGATMAVKKEFALQCIDAPKGTLHDYWYALCAPMFGEIDMVDEACICYRQHGNNVMGVPGRGIKGKIVRWKRTLKKLEKDWGARYERANELLKFAKQKKSAQAGKLETWYQFCKWRYNLLEKNPVIGFFEIINHALRGEYHKYINRTGCVTQDLIFVLLKGFK